MKFITSAIVAAFSLHTSSAFTNTAKSPSVAFTQSKNTIVTATLRNYGRSLKNQDVSLHVEATRITMPALSSTMKEGRVISWMKSEGDAVSAGEVLYVVESDKADMDVEAFEDGFVAKILVQEGQSAPVGDLVALLAAEESEIELVAAMANGGGSIESLNGSVPTGTTTTSPAVLPLSSSVEHSQVFMPALSSTMVEGKVVSWLKAEGDKISAGEPIMVVESDKADMDVEAFEEGYLAAIITGEGDVCAVGAPVAFIAQNEADIPALQSYAASLKGMPASQHNVAAPVPVTSKTAVQAAQPIAISKPSTATSTGGRVVASPLAKARAQELGVDLNTVVGTGPEGRITLADVEKAASVPVGSSKKEANAPTAAEKKPAWVPAPGVIAATPMARALAKKAKLDISTIKGTGEFGRVTVDDIKIATGEKKPEHKATAKASGAPAVELPEGLVKFTGMQRAVSKNMEATLATPVFRVSREIEMDKFDNLYQQLKPKGVTVSALLAKAVGLALAKFPIINSSYSPEGTVYNKDINVAMAVAIDGGLITPVLKYANERSIIELGENWKELVQKAKDGKLSPDEYQTGTFTISNLGMFGVTQFDAILPKGMGGILAIGSTQEVIVPCNQAVLGMKKVKKMTVTLTCDHRQIYGADGALFLKELANVMENKLDALSR